jgi:acetolactate synthase small subunit
MSMPAVPAPAAESRPFDPDQTACFAVHGDADPGVMPRVLDLFARRGLTPSSWHSRVGGVRGEELVIDVQMTGMVRREAEYVASCLRRIPGVCVVLTSQRVSAAGQAAP